jgi:hypothetical protein
VAGKAQTSKKPLVDEDRLTVQLAQTVMHWRVVPDRFIKSGRSWIPKWRFSPFTRIEDAFLLLDHAGGTYTLSLDRKGVFATQIRIGGRVGKASGDSKPQTITLAIAKALGLEALQ